MDRRTSLKTLMAATGGLIALPAWANGWSSTEMEGLPSSFTVTELDLLASVVDTIIPAGNRIGALSVGVDKFIQRLLDNCYETEIRENVKNQLNELQASQAIYGIPFTQGDQQQRQGLLLKLATSSNKQEKDFFDLMKAETIRGFNTSKEVMLGYLKYKMVPGHYYGCVDVTT
jgi:hypothetical protein